VLRRKQISLASARDRQLRASRLNGLFQRNPPSTVRQGRGRTAWRIAHRAAEYGDPVRDAELLETLSPLHKADAIACPLLVAQGLTDPRVPPHESEQIVAALWRRDIPWSI